MKSPYCDKEMKEGILNWNYFNLWWQSKEGHFWNKEKVYIREPFDCGMPKAYFCEESNKIIIDLNDKE